MTNTKLMKLEMGTSSTKQMNFDSMIQVITMKL